MLEGQDFTFDSHIQMFNVRPALISDAHSIAVVHVESKSTYSGLLPASALSKFTVERRESSWTEMLTTPEPHAVTLVGCNAQQEVVGFASGGAERTGQLGCDGELHAIYLLPAVQRQGLGTLLVERFIHELRSRGFRSMAVWVLGANPYRKFYEALGGQFIAEKIIERGGEAFVEIAYGWDDLSKFKV
jgi:GNAT superfamily N-acetyltransferase